MTRRPLAFDSTPGLIYAHDLGMAALAMGLTLVVRYRIEGKPLPQGLLPTAVVFFVVICAVVFPLFGLRRALWRYTALNDLWRVVQAAILANLLLLPALFAWNRLEDFPRSTPFVASVLLTLLLSAGRVAARVMASGHTPLHFRLEDRRQPPAVIVGDPGRAGDFISKLRRAPERAPQIAGIVSLDEGRYGRTVNGAEVLGPVSNLAAVLKALAARDGRPPQVIVAEPRPTRALLETVIAAAGEAGAPVVRARPLGGGAPTLTPVQAADLLARPPRRLDVDRARSLIEGRRVLVTGAGGTIGGELTRQTARLNPAQLILLDASEYNLYAIDQALREEGEKTPWIAELGDIRSARRMRELFERTKPDVVLHAAALKHVPLMETHPAEAVLTNVAGAINIMKLAREHCDAFVFISTDKAVNPTNVMGATKRVAERAVQALARGGRARTAVVRFGNVLGSAGSVVPLFEKQIAQGGPLTVTHPEMLRWFMTVQEAAALVLQAAALPGDGEASVYVLDMGEPVKIDDLARQMIRLHGLRPDHDIAITYTGLRPGEKLTEEIFYPAETVRPTAADGVLAAEDAAPSWEALEPALDALTAAAAARDVAGVLRALQTLEPAFTPGAPNHPADRAADGSPEGV